MTLAFWLTSVSWLFAMCLWLFSPHLFIGQVESMCEIFRIRRVVQILGSSKRKRFAAKECIRFLRNHQSQSMRLSTLDAFQDVAVCLHPAALVHDDDSDHHQPQNGQRRFDGGRCNGDKPQRQEDRKSTRLNSSHMSISYAVFCLKKKKKKNT